MLKVARYRLYDTGGTFPPNGLAIFYSTPLRVSTISCSTPALETASLNWRTPVQPCAIRTRPSSYAVQTPHLDQLRTAESSCKRRTTSTVSRPMYLCRQFGHRKEYFSRENPSYKRARRRGPSKGNSLHETTSHTSAKSKEIIMSRNRRRNKMEEGSSGAHYT